MNTISQKTNIPIYVVAASVPTFFGFILWLSNISYTAYSAEKKVAELQAKQENYNNLLISIKEDLTLVKFKLQIQGEKNGSSK